MCTRRHKFAAVSEIRTVEARAAIQISAATFATQWDAAAAPGSSPSKKGPSLKTSDADPVPQPRVHMPLNNGLCGQLPRRGNRILYYFIVYYYFPRTIMGFREPTLCASYTYLTGQRLLPASSCGYLYFERKPFPRPITSTLPGGFRSTGIS